MGVGLGRGLLARYLPSARKFAESEKSSEKLRMQRAQQQHEPEGVARLRQEREQASFDTDALHVVLAYADPYVPEPPYCTYQPHA